MTTKAKHTDLTIETIRENISNGTWLERSVMAIFEQQTMEEQGCEATLHNNKWGFSSADAHLGTYYAKWIKKGRNLSRHHRDRAIKMMQKYAGQLLKLADLKAAVAKASRNCPGGQPTEAQGARAEDEAKDLTHTPDLQSARAEWEETTGSWAR